MGRSKKAAPVVPCVDPEASKFQGIPAGTHIYLLCGVACALALVICSFRHPASASSDGFSGFSIIRRLSDTQLQHSSSTASASSDPDWRDLLSWLRENGAYVHSGLDLKMVHHGGFEIRGVVTDTRLERDTVLLRMPKKLVYDFDGALPMGFDRVPECQLSESSLKAIQMHIKLASEVKKGSASFFHPYLKMLPTLADFRSFHPFLADSEVISSFGELPILGLLSDNYWMGEKLERGCVGAWNVTAWGNSFDLHPDDLVHSFFLQTTRKVKGMVPLYDLLNTGLKSQVNTKTSFDGDHVIIVTTDEVASGAELLNKYRDDCDNEAMLAMFGVYLEAPSRKLNDLASVDCSAGTSTVSMKSATLAELDLDSKAEPSPRCKKNAQPMRCSLARLAWETCAQAWGMPGAVRWVDRVQTLDEKTKVHHWQAQRNRGALLRRKGDWFGALRSFKAALRISPGDSGLRRELKDLQQKIKQL